ncbi:hypothetical protein [Bdellovibrio sp. HCB-110]|uniref:hypothetical protein n=1 Tax=Bdellovibrio sp. HCB-110 TaxID=3391182 RepID=UPI0039B6255A
MMRFSFLLILFVCVSGCSTVMHKKDPRNPASVCSGSFCVGDKVIYQGDRVEYVSFAGEIKLISGNDVAVSDPMGLKTIIVNISEIRKDDGCIDSSLDTISPLCSGDSFAVLDSKGDVQSYKMFGPRREWDDFQRKPVDKIVARIYSEEKSYVIENVFLNREGTCSRSRKFCVGDTYKNSFQLEDRIVGIAVLHSNDSPKMIVSLGEFNGKKVILDENAALARKEGLDKAVYSGTYRVSPYNFARSTNENKELRLYRQYALEGIARFCKEKIWDVGIVGNEGALKKQLADNIKIENCEMKKFKVEDNTALFGMSGYAMKLVCPKFDVQIKCSHPNLK